MDPALLADHPMAAPSERADAASPSAAARRIGWDALHLTATAAVVAAVVLVGLHLGLTAPVHAPVPVGTGGAP